MGYLRIKKTKEDELRKNRLRYNVDEYDRELMSFTSTNGKQTRIIYDTINVLHILQVRNANTDAWGTICVKSPKKNGYIVKCIMDNFKLLTKSIDSINIRTYTL